MFWCPKSTLRKGKKEGDVSFLEAPEKKRKLNQAELTSAVMDLPFNRLDNAALSKRRFGNKTENDENGENYVGDSHVMASFSMPRDEPKSKSYGCMKNEPKLDSCRRILSDHDQEQDPNVTPFSTPTTMKRTPITGKQRNEPKLYSRRRILSDDDQEQDPNVTPFSTPTTMKRTPITGKQRNEPKLHSCRDILSDDDQEQDPNVTPFSTPTTMKRTPITGKQRNEPKLYSRRRIFSDDDQEQDPNVTPFSTPTTMKRTPITGKQRNEPKLYSRRRILSDDDQEQDPKMIVQKRPKSCLHVHCLEDEEDMAKISFYEFNKKAIGFGALGTSVYGGKSLKDGGRIAMKKIHCHTEKQTRLYKREIKHLLMLRGCSNIVYYLDVVVKQDIVYIILELMEGTLESLLSQPNLDITFTELSEDVINALKFLHGTAKIIHRDIKPRNILYVTSPRIMLKLADFGLSKMIESDSSTAGYTGGTRCWMAPEVLKNLDQFSAASDVFASGLVLHYMMTSKNPFAPANGTANKESRLFMEYQTVHNILNNSPTFDGSISPEALHLIHQMLDENKEQRPSADEILGHPFFWTNQKKVKFLEAVANQPEIHQSHSKPKWASDFGKDLESSFGVEFLTKPWSEFSTSMKFVYDEMMLPKKRKYNTSSAVDLLRFIRNAHQHVSDSSRTNSFQKFILEDHVFFDNFKTFFMKVYKTVRKHEWDRKRHEIKYIS